MVKQSDGSVERDRAQLSAQQEAALARRIAELETRLAQIEQRLQGLEALSAIWTDEPIPYEPAALAQAA